MSRKDITILVKRLLDSRLVLKENFASDNDMANMYLGEMIAYDMVYHILTEPKFAKVIWNTWMTEEA